MSDADLAYYFQKFDKLDIARSFLELAIEAYKKGENYFAALHLAGAAEEILGKQLRAKAIATSLESERDGFILVNKELFGREITEKYAADFLNKGKNSIKHMNALDSNDRFVFLDPRAEAKTMLDRAITNWWRLEQDLSENMEAFWK